MLPAIILRMIDLIGKDATLLLIKNFGGLEINLPLFKNCQADNKIAQCIGLDNLKKLTKHFAIGANSRYYIPSCAAFLNQQRNVDIVTQYSSGVSTVQLSKKYNTSQRNIKRILKNTDITEVNMNNYELFAKK